MTDSFTCREQIVRSFHPHTRPVYVCLCLSYVWRCLSRGPNVRVFLSLSVCLLRSVYVVAKTSRKPDKSFLYEVEGGDVFVAYVFSYFLQRKTYEKLRLTARVILLVEFFLTPAFVSLDLLLMFLLF